jgi:hypothetical protein
LTQSNGSTLLDPDLSLSPDPLVLLAGIEANGQPLDAYAAGYFPTAVLHAM